MKNWMLLVAVVLLFGMTSCGGDEYDDTALKQQIADLEKRVSAAETVLRAYDQALFIKSVTTTSNGYVITFSDNSKATITNGKDGADGQPGKDGKDGDAWIKDVQVGEREVTFTMTDGRSFSIPLSTLVGNIQHLSFVPTHSDGRATVAFRSAADATLQMTFTLSPAELAADVVAKWSELMSVEAVLTATRAAEPILLTVSACEMGANGRLEITASATALGENFFASGCGAAAVLKLGDGVTTFTSDYVPLYAAKEAIPANQLYYTTTNNQTTTPKTAIMSGVSVVENSYTDGLGIMTFSSALREVAASAFSAHATLSTVELPEGVETIRSKAFQSCKKLTKATLPASVETIEQHAFAQSGLQSVTILGTPSIGQFAFSNCKNSYNQYTLTAFYGPLASADNRALMADGTLLAYATASGNGYEVPAGVKKIGATAFANCEQITTITLPDGVEEIETYAFYYCFALTTINIPEGVTTIGEYAFMGDRGLKSLTLPATTKKLAAGAFRGCSAMTTLTLNAVTPPSLYSGVFAGCSADLKIAVPASAVDAYKEHEDWSNYAAQIVAQ